MRFKTLLLIGAALLYAAPASAVWSSAAAVDHTIVNRKVISTYDFTTKLDSDTLSVAGCGMVELAFDPSTGDTSTDATIEVRSCNESTDTQGKCMPQNWTSRGEGLYSQFSAGGHKYVLIRVLTSPVSDTARVLLRCTTGPLDSLASSAGIANPVEEDVDFGGFDALNGGSAEFQSFVATGGTDEAFGLDLDQVVGTPDAAAANHIKVVNDDGVLAKQITTAVNPIIARGGADPLAASTDNEVCRFDGTTGLLVQSQSSTPVIIADGGGITTPGNALVQSIRTTQGTQATRGFVAGDAGANPTQTATGVNYTNRGGFAVLQLPAVGSPISSLMYSFNSAVHFMVEGVVSDAGDTDLRDTAAHVCALRNMVALWAIDMGILADEGAVTFTTKNPTDVITAGNSFLALCNTNL